MVSLYIISCLLNRGGTVNKQLSDEGSTEYEIAKKTINVITKFINPRLGKFATKTRP